MTKAEIITECMNDLFTTYSVNSDKPRLIKIYARALQDWIADDWRMAVDEYMISGTYFPKPIELIQALTDAKAKAPRNYDTDEARINRYWAKVARDNPKLIEHMRKYDDMYRVDVEAVSDAIR